MLATYGDQQIHYLAEFCGRERVQDQEISAHGQVCQCRGFISFKRTVIQILAFQDLIEEWPYFRSWMFNSVPKNSSSSDAKFELKQPALHRAHRNMIIVPEIRVTLTTGSVDCERGF